MDILVVFTKLCLCMSPFFLKCLILVFNTVEPVKLIIFQIPAQTNFPLKLLVQKRSKEQKGWAKLALVLKRQSQTEQKRRVRKSCLRFSTKLNYFVVSFNLVNAPNIAKEQLKIC